MKLWPRYYCTLRFWYHCISTSHEFCLPHLLCSERQHSWCGHSLEHFFFPNVLLSSGGTWIRREGGEKKKKSLPGNNHSFEGTQGLCKFQFHTLLSFPTSLLSVFLSLATPPSPPLAVILWGGADSRGMIEEGLLEQGGKWSANGTLAPIGHLLTLHSPAAHSVGMCAWGGRLGGKGVRGGWQHEPYSPPLYASSQSACRTLISLRLFFGLTFVFSLPPFFFAWLFSAPAFNCLPLEVRLPPESHRRVTSTFFQRSSDDAKPDYNNPRLIITPVAATKLAAINTLLFTVALLANLHCLSDG